jgi:5'-3' exonuclease/transcription antitermination factor NusG
MLASTQWVVLELTAKAEGEDPDVIRASIRHHIREAEVFVPASVVERGVGSDKIREVHYLVDGYAFILHKHPDSHYSRLEDTKYVQGPLYKLNGNRKERVLAMVSPEQIARLRAQIKVEVDQGIDIGDTVIITSGPYKNILAAVQEDVPEQDSVVVHIQLRSTDRLVTLPRAFLHLETKSPHVVYRDRFERLSSWARNARLVARWPARRLDAVLHGFTSFAQWHSWFSRGKATYDFVRAYHSHIDFTAVRRKLHEFQRLCAGALLREQLVAAYTPLPDLGPMLAKHREVAFLDSAYSRIATIYRDVNTMATNTIKPVNLVVDGTQLFIRCAEAPGLGSLTDATGRPTGAIVGFLRSLGSYKKRFPTASIYVCWDGSSQRRKAMFPEYKGNRVSRSEGEPSFGWAWMRETLPLLGVLQAFHPEEEADDVIAALVHGPLKDLPNVILTTDRDMLQLVSEFTYQLCPAVGAGKEKLYDPALVEAEYGVPPTSMVHVRALSGDSSDNIPGVPNFGLKTSSKIVKLYGTVTALLRSNLAGLGKAQVANLREHEKQILLNIDLLTLRDVEFRQIESNPNQTEVEARLVALGIKSEPILAAFFPRQLTIT